MKRDIKTEEPIWMPVISCLQINKEEFSLKASEYPDVWMGRVLNPKPTFLRSVPRTGIGTLHLDYLSEAIEIPSFCTLRSVRDEDRYAVDEDGNLIFLSPIVKKMGSFFTQKELLGIRILDRALYCEDNDDGLSLTLRPLLVAFFFLSKYTFKEAEYIMTDRDRLLQALHAELL